MLPKTSNPRAVLHHRVNQDSHENQPHHGVKREDALPHPSRSHTFGGSGTPGSTQRTGTQCHSKIVDRHAEAAAGALLALMGRRH